MRRLALADPSPESRAPVFWRVVAATAISLGASLGADALLVVVGTALFPGTRGFSHFRFSDYATLTGIGVVAAAPTWPVVARVSSAPRWLFLRLAVVVTLALWLPDVWLVVVRGEPVRAVGVLVAMHLAIALITYNALVRLAPVRAPAATRPANPGASVGPALAGRPGVDRRVSWTAPSGPAVWIAMLCAVCVEFAVGVAALVLVPYSRADVFVPSDGRGVYILHALLGAAIGLAALALATATARRPGIARAGALAGLVGVAVAGAGGLIAVDHRVRLFGVAIMFFGAGASCLAYLTPLVSRPAPDPMAVADVTETRPDSSRGEPA